MCVGVRMLRLFGYCGAAPKPDILLDSEVVTAGLARLPCTGGYNHKAGQGTDHKGINKWSQHGNQVLSDTVLCLGSGMRYRSAAQACLI